jgi:predicted component of type VI protein secretion system
VAEYVLNFKDQNWLLFEGENSVGRSMANAVSLDLKGVSRHHCRIVISGDQATIEDLGSRFGTFVNGRLVKEATLQPGDKIRLGDATLELSLAGQAPAAQPAPAPAETPAEGTAPAETASTEPAAPAPEHDTASEGVVFCPECGLPNVIGEAQCFNCGTALPAPGSASQ